MRPISRHFPTFPEATTSLLAAVPLEVLEVSFEVDSEVKTTSDATNDDQPTDLVRRAIE
jgi:hypothetical protein